MRMKVAQVVEGIFEAMPMVDRRRYLTEKMLREYPSKINWVPLRLPFGVQGV